MSDTTAGRVCDYCHAHEQPVDPASRRPTREVLREGKHYCHHTAGRRERERRDDGATVVTFTCPDCPYTTRTVHPLPTCEPADKRVADLKEELSNLRCGELPRLEVRVHDLERELDDARLNLSVVTDEHERALHALDEATDGQHPLLVHDPGAVA